MALPFHFGLDILRSIILNTRYFTITLKEAQMVVISNKAGITKDHENLRYPQSKLSGHCGRYLLFILTLNAPEFL